MVITTEVLTFEKLFKIIDLAYEVNLQQLFLQMLQVIYRALVFISDTALASRFTCIHMYVNVYMHICVHVHMHNVFIHRYINGTGEEIWMHITICGQADMLHDFLLC